MIKDSKYKNIISTDSKVTSSGLMALMVQNNIRHVPIINDDQLLGLVSITDVITRLLDKQLKETELMKEWINSWSGNSLSLPPKRVPPKAFQPINRSLTMLNTVF
jgi:predicted transcriptional regulator